jgi:hypothetical protein
MARKKISTTVYFTPEQTEQLRLLNERTKVPVAVYIREGIDLVLAKYSHELPGQLTLDGPRQLGLAAVKR